MSLAEKGDPKDAVREMERRAAGAPNHTGLPSSDMWLRPTPFQRL